MDIARAKEIISALAEGIDPTTGEVLPADSVCNKGEVVRALYAILSECKTKEVAKNSPRKKPEDYDEVLYERLRNLRNKIATDKGLSPFMVFANATLMHMASQKPTTVEEMREIYGVGDYTTAQYGDVFLAEIDAYLKSTR